MHSFGHEVASHALLADECGDAMAFLLGYRDANLTRTLCARPCSSPLDAALANVRLVGARRALSEPISLAAPVAASRTWPLYSPIPCTASSWG